MVMVRKSWADGSDALTKKTIPGPSPVKKKTQGSIGGGAREAGGR